MYCRFIKTMLCEKPNEECLTNATCQMCMLIHISNQLNALIKGVNATQTKIDNLIEVIKT